MSTSTTLTTDRTMRPARDLATTAIPVIAVACFSVHVVLLLATGTSMLTMSVAMLLLSGLCVACTWRAGGAHGRRDQSIAAAAALTMILVHLLLMPSGAEGGHGLDHAAVGHAGMQMSSSSGGLLSSGAVYALMHAGVTLAALQVVLAGGAALRPRRRSTA
jgi:hypothetical protein